MNENLVPEEVAVEDMISFVSKWDEQVKTEEQVKELYPDVLKAIQSGAMTFDDDLKPTYSLQSPILNDKGEVSYKEIKFRTRIKASDLANITKGMNISKEQVLYLLKCMSYITALPTPIIDKLSKKDYRVLDQLSTIFL